LTTSLVLQSTVFRREEFKRVKDIEEVEALSRAEEEEHDRRLRLEDGY
jgi:hypothetical protein